MGMRAVMGCEGSWGRACCAVYSDLVGTAWFRCKHIMYIGLSDFSRVTILAALVAMIELTVLITLTGCTA